MSTRAARPPAPAPVTSLFLRIYLPHTVTRDAVTFHADPARDGPALRHFEEEVRRLIAEELAKYVEKEVERLREIVRGLVERVVAMPGNPSSLTTPTEARVRELEDAIGVTVPSILRCFIHMVDGVDREIAEKTLARVNAAMEVGLPAPQESSP